MILNAPGKISIMVDGQVVGTTAKPIHIVTENYTKAEAIAEAADIKRPDEKKQLMQEQHVAMVKYLDTLGRRCQLEGI